MFDFTKNHFELFQLPVDYNIDTEQLAARYRELQQVLHPDRFANAGDQERRLSLQAASRVNEAYQTLRDPMLRAKYMLLLEGVDMDSEQGTTQDMAFLMEQMELREQLAHARGADDPYGVIDALKRDIRQRLASLTGSVAQQFAGNDDTRLPQAQELVRKMQFLQKLLRDAETVEAELDDICE